MKSRVFVSVNANFLQTFATAPAELLMKRGYIRLYRKIDQCAVLQERGKRYSKKEAWIHLVMNEAAGVPTGDLKRGEFEVSFRYLAKKWNWSKTAVERFMADLEHCEEPMISRVGHFAGHFIICKYEIYNPTRDTLRDTLRDTILNKVLNTTERKDTRQPSADPSVLFEIYNSENKKLPQVQALTSDRAVKCRSRINQAVRDGCLEQYLSDFRAAVQKAQHTPFLCGEGARKWRANFDWFISIDKNVYGVLEGKYDGPAAGVEQSHPKDTIGAEPEEAGERDPERKAELRRIYAIDDRQERAKALQDYKLKYGEMEA